MHLTDGLEASKRTQISSAMKLCHGSVISQKDWDFLSSVELLGDLKLSNGWKLARDSLRKNWTSRLARLLVFETIKVRIALLSPKLFIATLGLGGGQGEPHFELHMKPKGCLAALGVERRFDLGLGTEETADQFHEKDRKDFVSG